MNIMPTDPAHEPQDDDALLTAEDAAAFLQVKLSWIYEHVRPSAHDRLPVMKLGKYLRFDRRDLRAYVDAKRAESHKDLRWR
jgi:predicted DNA-binding transcriptional regulator AlpA